MKKTLLFIAVACISTFTVNAQKTWNFSNFTIATFAATTTVNGLQIMAALGTEVSIDANAKVNSTYSFTQRLKLGGSGAWVSGNRYMPTTRALVFNVTGPGSITVAALSSSSSAERRLILTNGTDSLTSIAAPGTYVDGTNNIPLTTYQYTGGAATLYLYSVSSGVNIYLLDVSSAIATSVNKVLVNEGVAYNGKEISNTKSLALEVYTILGKKVASSRTSISTSNFQKGVYIVRIAGLNDAMKFCI